MFILVTDNSSGKRILLSTSDIREVKPATERSENKTAMSVIFFRTEKGEKDRYLFINESVDDLASAAWGENLLINPTDKHFS